VARKAVTKRAPAKARIRLIHWNAEEAKPRTVALEKAGFKVEFSTDSATLRVMHEDPPAAVVIDFTRRPSHGTEIALAIRQRKATRNIPILVVEGEPEKIARLKALLPDAVYTTWAQIGTQLKRAVASPPKVTAKPQSPLAGYSGTPLPKKLGIKPDSDTVLVGAPEGFEKTLGELPADARIRRQATGRPDLTLWFVTSRKQLERDVPRMVAMAASGGVWIVWPKKTSPLATDVGEADVRRVGLAAGLVDYKICAVDADWSGLKFALRKPR
jgi:CheY-like chemotaxis protein